MIYKTLLCLVPIFLCHTIFAQEKKQESKPYKFEKVTAADFEINLDKVDSGAGAVVIADVGSADFELKKSNFFTFIFKRTTRIKLINKNGFDLATIKFRFWRDPDEKLEADSLNFQASTYNLINGKVVETKLKNGDYLVEKLRKNEIEKKFIMPEINEGCIIEYSYTHNINTFSNLPAWNFQYTNAPCLYSEFEIGIPDMFRYLTVRHGADSVFSTYSEDIFKTLKSDIASLSTNIHYHKWIMKNIKSFKSEDYINYAGDYRDKMEFVLAQFSNGRELQDFRTSWKVAENRLLANKYFGLAINADHTTNLYNTMAKVSKIDGDIIDAAKQIYNYVRDNFSCVPNDDIYISNDLYEVNKKRKGSVAELNMLLIALLRQRQIKAEPIILSTKDYGIHPESYPILEKFNYVVCMLRFGIDTIYLDASDPKIGFGKLPLKCYNGHAQVIDEQHSGSVYFNPNTIKNQNLTSVFISNNEKDNGMGGNIEDNLSYYSAYNLRDVVKSLGGQNGYKKKVETGLDLDAIVSNFGIDSLSRLEDPAKITFDINFKNFNGADVIYFNPIVYGRYKENPFKAAERRFPVEMDYPQDDTYVLNMEIPKGYIVDEMPKSTKVGFNGKEGFFEYSIQKDATSIQLKSHIRLNEANFAPEDYQTLRDFFAYVVKKQSEQIVFKKAK